MGNNKPKWNNDGWYLGRLTRIMNKEYAKQRERFSRGYPRLLPVFNLSGLLTSLWARVHGVGVSVSCCGVLPLFTSTEGGYCQVTKETHWEKNVCNRWDVQIQTQFPIPLRLFFGGTLCILLDFWWNSRYPFSFFAAILVLFYITLRVAIIHSNTFIPSLSSTGKVSFYFLRDKRCDIFVWL